MGASLRQRRIGTVEALDMAIHGDVVDFTVEAEIFGKINSGEERHRVVEAAKIVASKAYCTIAVFRGATEVEAGEAGILRVVDTQVEVFQTASVGEFHVGMHLPGVEQEYSGFVFQTFGKLAAGVEVEELVIIETQAQRIGLHLVVILGRGCPVVDMFQVVEDSEVPIVMSCFPVQTSYQHVIFDVAVPDLCQTTLYAAGVCAVAIVIVAGLLGEDVLGVVLNGVTLSE